MGLKEKVKEILKHVSETGISIAYVKDPGTKKASVSLTLLIVSFTIVVIGIITKPGEFWQIDMMQAFNLLYLTTGLYFGRRVTSGTSTLSSDKTKKEQSKEEEPT